MKCAEVVKESLESTMEDINALWKAYCNGEEEVEDLGRFEDYGLSFDFVAPDTFEDQDEGYFRYQLSWGGPSTEFRFYTDATLEPYKVEYWHLDWFDGASLTLYDEDKATLLEIFEMFKECGTVEHVLEEAMEGA